MGVLQLQNFLLYAKNLRTQRAARRRSGDGCWTIGLSAALFCHLAHLQLESSFSRVVGGSRGRDTKHLPAVTVYMVWLWPCRIFCSLARRQCTTGTRQFWTSFSTQTWTQLSQSGFVLVVSHLHRQQRASC